jgi:starvation-inducible DNA-binding protein
LHQKGVEVQTFGSLRLFPIALAADARRESCQLLNHILADSIILYSSTRSTTGSSGVYTFYQLHLLLDKHAGEQLDVIDLLAERIIDARRRRYRRSPPRRTR